MKLRKKIGTVMLTFICLITITAMGSSVKVSEKIMGRQYYQYPITSGSKEWNDLENTEARIEACRIPTDTLKAMTEDELVQAVFDFPYVIDVAAYSSIEKGLEVLAERSDAYKELLTRVSGKEALLNKASMVAKQRGTMDSKELTRYKFIIPYMLLHEKKFNNDLSLDDLGLLNDLAGFTVYTTFPQEGAEEFQHLML